MLLTGLGPELRDLAVALGILDSAGNLRTEWFAHPIGQSGAVFRDATRRAALDDLIAGLLPADPSAPTDPDGAETWHPLTGTEGPHRVYLTVRRTTSGLALGLAARVSAAASAVTLALGLVEARDDGLHAVVGAPGNPVRARLDVTVDATGTPGFEGLSIDAALTPGATDPVRLTLVVQGLRVGDEILPAVTLDPTRLDRDLVPLLENLGQDRLGRLAGDATVPAPLRALAGHLLPLVGAGGGVPRLPVERIGLDPGVLAQWFTGIVDGNPAVWLAHLAGLFGSAVPVTGAGTDAEPWQVRLADGIALTLAVRAGAAGRELGLGVALLFPGPGGLAVDGRAELLALPLTGPGPARAVSSATLAVRAPGDPSGVLVAADQLHVAAARAGLSWDGSALRPILELSGVVFEGVSYPRLDLSNVDSVRAAAVEAARATITAAIGTDGPGAHLAVLLGLVAPPGEPGAPVADLAALLSAPTRELTRVHRARLLDPGHSWATMLGQIAALLGGTDPVTGAGTASDPWRVPLASAGPVSVALAAWTGDPAGTTGDLHLGLSAAASATVGPATIDATVLPEIVRLSLPATGPVVSRLLGRHQARLAASGPFTLSTVDGIGLTLGGADARLDWTAGQSLTPLVELTGLTVHLPDGDVTLPALHVPPAGGFDPHRPDLGLGVPPADLDRLVRGLLARLWGTLAGPDGVLAGALLGLRTGDDALPPDWPLPELPAGGLSALLADPLAVLRNWLDHVALAQSLDGGPFVRAGLAALRRLTSPASGADRGVAGDGTWAAPWRVDLAGPGGSQLLVWLEPDGPPAGWSADSAQRAATTETPDDLLALMGRSGSPLAALAAQFGGAYGPSTVDTLGDAWGALIRRCRDGDGVVPLDAQFATGPDWTAGLTLVDAAHHRLPEHPDAVAQVLAQVAGWAPGAVLLIGPPFTGRTSWQPMLDAAEAAQPGSTSPDAHFDLRTPPSPELADLTATTVAARWYTADLADPGGDLTPVVNQIAAVVGRIRQLRGNAPVALVAHATAGLAARAFAAANPGQVAGLVTLGTPYGAAPLTVLDDPTEADAVRLAARLLDAGQVTGSLPDAVDHLLAAAESWQAGTSLPTRLEYPRDRYTGQTDQRTGGVPALAIGGQLAADPVTVLGNALSGALSTPTDATTPTHLAFGLRVGLAGAVPAPGGVAIDAGLRVDLARLSLTPVAAAGTPTAPPQRIAVEIRVDRPGGFLLDPADGRGVRLRRAELSVVVESGPGAGPVQAGAVFHDAGIDGPTATRVTLADPGADRLLSSLVSELTAGPAVLDALVALELASRDGTGAVTVLADAVEALRTDPGAYLGPRLRTALDTAPDQLGLAGPAGGPWTATDAAAPLGFELADDRLTVRLAGLRLAGAGLTAEVIRRLDGSAARVAFTAGPLRWDPDAGTLLLDPGAGQPAVPLVPPPDPAALAPVLLQRLAVAVGAAALADRLGPGWTLGPLVDLLVHPAAVLTANVDGDHVGALLRLLGGLVGAAPDGDGLALPGGLVLRASGVPSRISLRTEPPFPVPGVAGGATGAATLELDLDLAPGAGVPTVAGALSVDVPLGGTWGGLTLVLALDHGTVSLAVTPRGADGTPLAPIVLLPRFGGLGPLAADAVAALLPAVLDALVTRLPTPHPAVAAAVLAVADAAGLHGGAGDPSFAGHAGQLRALAGSGGLTALATPQLPAAIGQLWTAAGLPGTVSPSATGVTVQATVGGLTLTLDGGWGATPAVRLSVAGLTAGPIAVNPLTIGYVGGAVAGELTVSVALPAAAEAVLGLQLRPALRVEVGTGGLAVYALPLGTGTADLLKADLLPAARLELGTGGIGALVERLAAPLFAQLAVDHCASLDAPLFTGGPSAATVLRDAGVLAADARRLVVPLPAAGTLVPRLLGALAATGATVPIGDGLTLSLVTDHSTTPPRLGLGLHGQADLGGGVSVRLGEPAPTWLPDGAPALRLLLIEQDSWRVRPALRLAPLGLGLAGTDGHPLVDSDEVRLGGVVTYLWATLDLDGGLTVSGLGGALDLADLGLPLGAVASGNTASNPVAGSLLDSSGGGSGGSGDGQAVLPGLSLVAAHRPGSDFTLLRREDDAWIPFAARPLWLGVHRSFGPLTVDQVGFAHRPAPAGSGQPGTAQVFVDGGVQVGPLTVQAHELGVDVPLDRLDQPGAWGLDLAGLAVAVQSDGVSLAGGLVKRAGPPVDYAGALTVQVAGRTFTAIGAYARPDDAAGSFTSLFVFAGLNTPLGGPPYLFVTGLGAGAGYNRRLVPPAQITDVETFPLVTAIDNGIGDDPMGTLTRLGDAMVPERGSLWLAAGIRFTSFSFVRSVAVAYAALDRGVEIGLVGVSRASIPPPDAGPGSLELASVELALKARFSTAAGLLSVQAQLTDNSWLLSRDCQLTGGFAFFLWFHRDQFVLTLGGYHPTFVRPADFPVVPRLGFHWAVSDAVVVKGESYFALTSSSVMAGGRLEVAYNNSGVYASFTAYADFLIEWDPFHYDVTVGVTVTAGFRLRACFFVCVTIDVHVTLGAKVHLLGPPLHGEAELDLEIATVTVAFGNEPHAPPTFLGWTAFRDKYVVAGAPDGSALTVVPTTGLVPPDGPAVGPAPGSLANPWRMAGVFALRTETRVAATGYSVNGTVVNVPLSDGLRPVPAALDLAPMNVAHVTGRHDLSLHSATSPQTPVDLSRLDIEPIVGHVPAAVWRITGAPTASADVIPVLIGLTITGQPAVADDGGRPEISLQVIDFNTQPVPIGLSTTGLSTTGLSTTARATAAAPQLAPARLRGRRSSPPVTTPVPAGPAPTPASPAPAPVSPAPASPAPVSPAPVSGAAARPRLVASVQVPVDPAAVAAHRTTVAGAVGIPRVAPPPAADRPLRRTTSGAPPTRPAGTGRTGVAADATLAPGAVQVWDLPHGTGRWIVTGPGAARLVFLDRAGLPRLDHEITPASGGTPVSPPPGAVRLAVLSLGGAAPATAALATAAPATAAPGSPVTATAAQSGAAPGSPVLGGAAGPGAVSLAVAPSGRATVCGWQSGNRLVQVAPATLLGRGATVHLPTALPARRGGHALIPAASAVAGRPWVDTVLPADIDVLGVVVDATGDAGSRPGVSVEGGTVAAEPTVVVAGRRRYLLYRVVARDAPQLAVRVTTGDGWQAAGVLGLPGTVGHWAGMLTNARARHLVPDGPISPDGSITVRYEQPTAEPVGAGRSSTGGVA